MPSVGSWNSTTETHLNGEGTHSTKMGADKSVKNTPNSLKCICPNWLPKPKSLGFWWKKASLGVRGPCPKARAVDINGGYHNESKMKWGKEWINKNIVKLQAYFLNIYKDQSTVSVTFWQRGEKSRKSLIRPKNMLFSWLRQEITNSSSRWAHHIYLGQ